MKILLSIKPQFANKIFEGTKLFEFRKSIFKNTDVKTIVVYASSPVQKVIGEFTIDTILEAQPDELWEQTKRHSGITRDFFDDYFTNKDKAYAIKIKETELYKNPLSLSDLNVNFAPQSFVYL